MEGSDVELTGRRVLLIEDEALVMMLLEDTLAETGCEIAGVASRVDEALEKANSLSFDVAVLDVNLNRRQTFDVARCTTSRAASGNAAFPSCLRPATGPRA
jgi:CheY-like chemotaxis protein